MHKNDEIRRKTEKAEKRPSVFNIGFQQVFEKNGAKRDNRRFQGRVFHSFNR